jgi:PAS domain S-box-containing protein
LPPFFQKRVDNIFIGPDAFVCGKAAYTGNRVMVEDVAFDSNLKKLLQTPELDVHACWSEPIRSFHGSQVLGTFAIYRTAAGSPSREEIDLMEMAADLAGMAIEWHQVSEERQDFEDHLKEANHALKTLNAELEERVLSRTEELRYQSQITQTITDNATGALFMMDARGYCTFLNPAAEKMTGYTFEEIRQKPLHDMIHHTHPDGTHFPIEECPIDRALPTNNDMRAHEDVFVRKDGSFFPVLCAARPIFQNGEPIGTVVEVRDITEEKKAQKQVLESSERFRLLLEAIPNMAWTARPDGNLDFYNQRWYEYTGQKQEEALNNGWQLILHPVDILGTVETWDQSIRSGEMFEKENRFKRKSDGQYRWHLVRGLPIRNNLGEITMWVGTCTEIHVQKIALVHLAEAQQQLRDANVELSRTNLQLKRINNDLDSFVYTASHDLKAPISNLEGLVEALKEEMADGNEEVLQMLQMATKSVDRLRITIQELSEISKIQKDMPDNSEGIHLEEMVQDLMLDFQNIIEDTEALVSTDFEEVKRIPFSRKNLRSILYNLLSNSLKYLSPDRRPEIHICSRRIDDSVVLLSVQDNGLGIKAEQKNQVFAMFKRLHNHVDGTGVGLYIVKRIVENAGGQVEVESEVGKGATFNVYLPV